jgi:YHS domain-containing protein
MNVVVRILVAIGVVALTGCGVVKNTVRDGDDAKVMLRGNDPVAYFTAGKPTPGSTAIKADHDGVTYRFASEANKAEFQRNPKRYVPAYAGFCASGAPYALKANIGADVFKIVDDRLYLFGSERSRRNWSLDEKENIKLGDTYWDVETKDVPHRLQNYKRYMFKVPHYKTDAELDAEYQRRFGKPVP